MDVVTAVVAVVTALGGIVVGVGAENKWNWKDTLQGLWKKLVAWSKNHNKSE